MLNKFFKKKKVETNPFFEQYKKELSDPKKLVIDLKNFKDVVYIMNNLEDKDPVFEDFLKALNMAIKEKKQILFEDFKISWKQVSSQVFYPELLNKNAVAKNNLYLLDFFNHKNIKMVELFKTLNRVLKHYFVNENLFLRIKPGLVIYLRQDKSYALLFNEEII